jgi:signal transduction histidine kinase
MDRRPSAAHNRVMLDISERSEPERAGMSTIGARRLALGLVLLGVVLLAIGLVWQILSPLGADSAPTAAGVVTVLLGLLVFGVVGTLIVGRFPGNLVGWAFCGLALAFPLSLVIYLYAYTGLIADPGSLPGADLAEKLSELLWLVTLPLTTVVLFLLFPNGRVQTAGERRVLQLAGVGTGLAVIGLLITPHLYGDFERFENPLGVEPSWVSGGLFTFGFFAILAAIVASFVALIRLFRRSRGDERQQMKWFVTAAALVFAIQLPVSIVETDSDVVPLIANLVLLAVPVSVGVAILKYRLYEIDVVIRKSVVYAILVGLILGVWLLVVWLGQSVLVEPFSDHDELLVLGGVVLGVLFLPLRRLATRIADRLVFRSRATPYEVLRSFADRVGGTYASEDVLPRMARVLAEGTGADRARIWLRVGEELRLGAAWPEQLHPIRVRLDGGGGEPDGIDDYASEVRHQGELLGAMSVSMPANDPMSPAKQELVGGLAAQAGLVLRNVRLIEDLRESRRRIVTAQDERARALERNIHDGAQQQLVALAVKQRLAASMIEHDERVREILEQLQQETIEALENLRDLARGIYPPLLGDKGLEAALVAQARKSPIPIEVHANGIDRSSKDVEAAIYFCVLEALQNVAKYAKAKRAEVRLFASDDALTFVVADDGIGFDPAITSGSGLSNIRDRLEALGGELDVRSSAGRGTTVTGIVPSSGQQPAAVSAHRTQPLP